MFKFFGALLLGMFLFAVPAQASNFNFHIFDKVHNDHHVWTRDEDRRYRTYRTQQHQVYRPIRRTPQTQQQAYWNWRHRQDGR